MVAHRHAIDNTVEPAPLGARVLVGPNRVVEIHHVAAAKSKHIRIILFCLFDQADHAGNATATGIAFGIGGQRMAVVIAKVIDLNRRLSGARALAHPFGVMGSHVFFEMAQKAFGRPTACQHQW